MTELDYGDIQGTILRGYRVDCARHLVLRVADRHGAQAFLGRLVSGDPELPQITTAARWTVKPKCFLNVGITYLGLEALGVPAVALASFPDAFIRGATHPTTAQLVGDVNAGDPARWDEGLRDAARVHIILSFWVNKASDDIEPPTSALRAAFAGALEEVAAYDASALPDNMVHFGYRDHIAQPHVEGEPPTKRPRPEKQPVAPAGEFLLGHRNQYDGVYRVEPEQLSTNSSFGAFRILEQDVVGFEEFLVTYSAQLGIDPELLAAKVCGRWRNGVPLTLSPDTPDPTPPIPLESLNDFDYSSDDPALDDTFGYRCPVGSHIRRANPRDQRVVGNGQHLHRIIRRGMPYGPRWQAGDPADGVRRGLMGWFINADIQNQFEFLHSEWLNDSRFVMSNRHPETGANPVRNISGEDPLSGVNDPATSSFTLSYPPAGAQKWRNEKVTGFRPFVTTRGGAYCHLPSITAIRYLAAGCPPA